MGCAVYEPRAAEGAVLQRLVCERLETFLRDAAERTDGGGLPTLSSASSASSSPVA